jgi:hypothetical protein
MADTLNLSLWFPGFEPEMMLPRMEQVLRLFPCSEQRNGVNYISVQPVNWAEPSLMERDFTPGATPEEACVELAEFAQPDYALSLEVYWDLWVLDAESQEWVLRPEKVVFTAQGLDFDEGAFASTGHMLVDFGLDYPFLHEGVELHPDDALRVKANVAALVEFTHRVEQHCNTTGRVLWSESDENLAQKLIARLQQVQ